MFDEEIGLLVERSKGLGIDLQGMRVRKDCELTRSMRPS